MTFRNTNIHHIFSVQKMIKTKQITVIARKSIFVQTLDGSSCTFKLQFHVCVLCALSRGTWWRWSTMRRRSWGTRTVSCCCAHSHTRAAWPCRYRVLPLATAGTSTDRWDWGWGVKVGSYISLATTTIETWTSLHCGPAGTGPQKSAAPPLRVCDA